MALDVVCVIVIESMISHFYETSITFVDVRNVADLVQVLGQHAPTAAVIETEIAK